MNDAQLRRRELLRQTKQLYGERETVPPIHPRYGNLCKEQDEGGEEAGAQSLDPKQFDTLMIDVKRRVAFEEKTLL